MAKKPTKKNLDAKARAQAKKAAPVKRGSGIPTKGIYVKRGM